MAITDEKTDINERINYYDYKKLDTLGTIDPNSVKSLTLFNKSIRTYKDIQLNHIHIKLNSACNARCSFCIEKGNERYDCDENDYYVRLRNILAEFKKNHILYSVSVTGGEPTIDKKFLNVLDILDEFKVPLLTINTNGSMLLKYSDEITKYKISSINISRHHFDDIINQRLFGCKVVPTVQDLKEIYNVYKSKNPKCLIRLQCIMQKGGIENYKDICDFRDILNFVDDYSFRELMTVDDTYDCLSNSKINTVSLGPVLEEIQKNTDRYEYSFQRVVDYYVYEGYFDKTTNKAILVSFSNMKDLNTVEQTVQDQDMYREFIYFQDGIFTGSWSGVRKVLLDKLN